MDSSEEIDNYFEAIYKDLFCGIDHTTSDEEILSHASNFQYENAFQSLSLFNKYLPYADELHDEADALLVKIKSNLGRCAIRRDIKYGCVTWSKMLNKYINLYGLRFTKDDHINFIKLTFEFLVIPNLESSLIIIFAELLYQLLRKSHLISYKELEIPWRVLYNLYAHCKNIQKPMKVNFNYDINSAEEELKDVIRAAKIYFPVDATQEILDELRPQINPFDEYGMPVVMEFFELFLPIQNASEYHVITYELWLHELMKLWEVCGVRAQPWESSIMILISKLAFYKTGYINWKPYIPIMFTRILKSFDLSVCYNDSSTSDSGSGNGSGINSYYAALWIASTLGGGSDAQMYLEKLLRTIETYFYLPNHGPWLEQLEDFLAHIACLVALRIHRERYQVSRVNLSWEVSVPENRRLTDSDIDALVNSMMPIAVKITPNNSYTFYLSLHFLALMRPKLVIPKILEETRPIFESEIESHKLTSAMTCMIAISQSLVQGSRINDEDHAFHEGPSLVLPVLFSSLSGINPIDPTKVLVTFRLISTYATMIPIADCSRSASAMNENDRLVCEATAQFEDFVLQFMEKVFAWINSNSLKPATIEDSGLDNEDDPFEDAIGGVFSAVLHQTSSSIFCSALNKLRSFVGEIVLETKVTGYLVAIVCSIFSSIDGHQTLKTLLPVLAEKIIGAIGVDEDVIEAENSDSELLYPLLLLSSIVLSHGDAIQLHLDTLVDVMDKTLRLKCREGNRLSCYMLRDIMSSLCRVRFFKIERNLDDPEYPYVNDWGRTLDVTSVRLKSFAPGHKELDELQRIFQRYFLPAVEAIRNFTRTENSMTRHDLRTTLDLILNVLLGCSTVLPIWDEPPIEIESDENHFNESFMFVIGPKIELLMPDGSNVRYSMVDTMISFQEVMLKNFEDDTESLIMLQEILESLLLGDLKCEEETTSESSINFGVCKTITENKMTGNDGWFPSAMCKRVIVAHNLRVKKNIPVLTKTHSRILMKLLELSTSRYCSVRIKAQEAVQSACYYFPQICITCIPYIVRILESDPIANHQAYKGALYLTQQILYNVDDLIVKYNWRLIKTLWSALVLSKCSEKSSVVQLKERLIGVVRYYFYTARMKLDIPHGCILAATKLLTFGHEPSTFQSQNKKTVGEMKDQQKLTECNMNGYNTISESMHQFILERNLPRQHRLMAMTFMYVLLNPEQAVPPTIVRFFVNALISELPDEREIALKSILLIFKQTKKKYLKERIKYPTGDEYLTENKSFKVSPGLRLDNAWLQYNYVSRPTNADSWDEPRYVHKNNFGYYSWPKEFYVYSAPSKQPRFDKHFLTAQEREIHHFFNCQQNVDRLIEYFSIENDEDCDDMLENNILFFKGLFQNFDDAFLPYFLPHLRELVDNQQKHKQRCAAEMVCGLLKGSKHWIYEMTECMWDSLRPIICNAMNHLSEETIYFWRQCIFIANRNRDPNKLHWLFESLMEETALEKSDASFVEYGKFLLLQCALKTQSWRVIELLHRLLRITEERLNQNLFQLMRKYLAANLLFVFGVNLELCNSAAETLTYPNPCEFMEKIFPRLQSLAESIKPYEKSTPTPLTTVNANDVDFLPIVSCLNYDESERVKDIRLFKTICFWMTGAVVYPNPNSLSLFYKVYPIINCLQNSEEDDELYDNCVETTTALSQSLTLPEHVPIALEAMIKVSNASSWSSRKNCLKFLQVFVFSNMSILLSNESWMCTIQQIVLKLLEDVKVEVREQAAKVLSGLLHCTLISDEEGILEKLKKIAATKLNKNKLNDTDQGEGKDGVEFDPIPLRHAGVLGMCAYIQAHPYDIPKYIPTLFECLSHHSNDPAPIPDTIRETLQNFKHTHCDEWTGVQGLAEKFTEDQLAVIQDLAIPPSYCA